MKGAGDPTGDLLEVLSKLVGNGMVTSFVLVAEYLDEDGDVRLWADTMTGQRSHRTLGLLEFGAQVERTRITQAFLEDDD